MVIPSKGVSEPQLEYDSLCVKMDSGIMLRCSPV